MKKLIASLCLLCVTPIVIPHVHGTASTTREQQRIEQGLKLYQIVKSFNDIRIKAVDIIPWSLSNQWWSLGKQVLNFRPSNDPLDSFSPHIITESTTTKAPLYDVLLGREYTEERKRVWMTDNYGLVMLSPGNQWFTRLAFQTSRFPQFHEKINQEINNSSYFNAQADKVCKNLAGLKQVLDDQIAALKKIDVSSLTSPTDKSQTTQSQSGTKMLFGLSQTLNVPAVKTHAATYKLWYQNKNDDEIVANWQNITNPNYVNVEGKNDQFFGKAIYQWKKNIANLMIWGNATMHNSLFKSNFWSDIFSVFEVSQKIIPIEAQKMCDMVPEIIQYGEMLSSSLSRMIDNYQANKTILQTHSQALKQAADAASKL